MQYYGWDVSICTNLLNLSPIWYVYQSTKLHRASARYTCSSVWLIRPSHLLSRMVSSLPLKGCSLWWGWMILWEITSYRQSHKNRPSRRCCSIMGNDAHQNTTFLIVLRTLIVRRFASAHVGTGRWSCDGKCSKEITASIIWCTVCHPEVIVFSGITFGPATPSSATAFW